MAYTTKQQVENYLDIDIPSSLDSQVNSWISMVQKWIENYTKRKFEKETLEKRYDGSGLPHLDVHDLLSVDSIIIKDTAGNTIYTLSDSDYFLYSDNDDPSSFPKNRIVFNPYGGYYAFDAGLQNIWITGDWGYSETVPDDIKMAATKLVASIIKAGKDQGISSYSEGDLSVSYQSFDRMLNSDLSVKAILDWYKKPERLTGINVNRT